MHLDFIKCLMIKGEDGMGNRVRTISTKAWYEEYKDIIKIESDILEGEKRGVYAFFVNDECIYIGKAINIESRIFEHLTKLKWLSLNISLKDIPEHIIVLKKAFDDGEKIEVKILDIVEYKYDNYYRDLHRLAFREYSRIEEYQEKGQCLNQYPEGSVAENEYESWLEHSLNN